MKKGALLILSLSLFVVLLLGGILFLCFSPRGALRTETPEAAMQSFLDTADDDVWRAEFCRTAQLNVSPFEDAAQTASLLFDTLPAGEYSFRECEGDEDAAEFIVSRGETDFLRMRCRYSGGHWQSPESVDASYISGETHSLRITVPEESRVTVNSVLLGTEYIESDAVPYPDISDLETRFSDVPHRVTYRVDGLYTNASVSAERKGGLILLSGGDDVWEYTLPDAAGHSFRITAPAEAVVTVNGAALTEADVSAVTEMPVSFSMPEHILPLLPSYRIYAAGGLYSIPEISAAMPDGTTLLPTENGENDISFALPGTDTLCGALSDRVDGFITSLLHFGAGHTVEYSPTSYITGDSPLLDYCSRARSSLMWTVNVTLTISDIGISEIIPLGEDACICTAYANYTTRTGYETKEFSQDYQTLWLRQGDSWYIYDFAFI